jgi:hypothetical protein
MMPDGTYLSDPALAPARHLQRAGQWAHALALAGDHADLRAEILTERFIWRMTGADEAVAAARAAAEPVRSLLLAQISYTHKASERPSPVDIDELAVFVAVGDGWAHFWRGCVLDNALHRPDQARAAFAEARARMGEDRFLESYVVRHEAFHLIDTDRPAAIALARRSLHLRSALGTRAQTAAAQYLLADLLAPDDPEVAQLREAHHATATELDIPRFKIVES